ncbi:methyltransferase regulatory domain-containing protein [Pseudochelatococcus sp. G4_1912]|uniref:methyltransferase regulatory domain-containing protein n=1 Tax=Pseudochelatococcus sp. G4_1912 TaxID=3114288 RepID=UPI0039C5E681
MSEWSEGYVTEVEYTIGFFAELAPELLRFAMLSQGLDAPRGPISYLELGAGHGLTSNIIAAVNPDVDVVAVDFNPTHITRAKALADKAGTKNVKFLERSFQDLARDDSLQSFDIIALHGVYSWVSEANRGYIRDIIRRNLKPGGIVYVSYNAYPGWSSGSTLQRVLRDGGALGGGSVQQQVSRGIGLLNRLKELNAGFFASTPGADARLEDMKKHPISYLAHEYMNSDWDAFFFSDVAKALGESKVVYGTQANLAGQTDLLNFTQEQRELLGSVPDPIFREMTRDIILNTSFRRDIYVRGANQLSKQVQKDIWNNQRFVLLQAPADVPRKIGSRVGEVTLQAEVYDPVLAALAKGPQTLADLMKDEGVARISWERAAEALHFLAMLGVVHLALPAEGDADRAVRAKAVNTAILERVEAGDDIQALASPVTGSGVGIDNLSQLFVLAHWKGAEDKVVFVRQILKDRGHNVMKDGVVVEDEELALTCLRDAEKGFNERTMKVLQRTGIL